MLAILNSLNAHIFPMFQSILMILVSKFMVHRALPDKTHLSLGLLSPFAQRRLRSSSNQQAQLQKLVKIVKFGISLV